MDIDLSNLTPEQLKSLRAKINFLLKNKEEYAEDTVQQDYNIIKNSVAKLVSLPPYYIFKNTKNYKTFLNSLNEIEAFLTEYFPKASKLEKQIVIGKICLCTCSFIQDCKMDINPTVFFNNLVYVNRVIDCCFPGYIASGLIDKILGA